MKGLSMILLGAAIAVVAFGCGGGSEEAEVAEAPHGEMPADAMHGQQPENVSVKAAISHAMMAGGNMIKLHHPVSEEEVELRFHFVHDEVRETAGGRYVASVDFMDAEGTAYVVDFYVVETEEGKFEVADAVIYKEAGEEILSAEVRERLEQAQ
jgi:hypothetical protein